MNTTPFGLRTGHGFFAGVIKSGKEERALVLAPKSEGETFGAWSNKEEDVSGTDNAFDGAANTDAMSGAGSGLASFAKSSRIGGVDDWHIPSRDELELVYQNLKNSGLQAFIDEGEESLANEWYWSSTQVSSELAWCHDFHLGTKGTLMKEMKAFCRLVRTVPLSELTR